MSLYLLCGSTPIDLKPPVLNSQDKQRKQHAVFLASKMWPVKSTISIYIYDTSKIQIISRSAFNNKRAEDKPNYIFWYDFSDVSDSDLDKYWDPLYKTIQGKVTPDELVKRVVLDRLAPLVNINFTFTNNIDDSTIRIKFDSTRGCNSLVGTDNDLSSRGLVSNVGPRDPTMYLGWLDVATTLHEFGHVLGMAHEHSNPLKNPIMWNLSGLECYYGEKDWWTSEQVKENIIKRYSVEETNGSEFDPASIMIYSFPASVICKGQLVKITDNGISMDAVYKLSNSDIQWLQAVYPASGVRDPNVIKNLPKSVLPTDVYSPKTTMNLIKKLLDYLKDSLKLVGYLVAVLVLVFLGYLFLRNSRKSSMP